ncbi:MAG: SRPBCC family protein [Anaerolineales bacterium]
MIHQLQRRQIIPAELNQVWDYFSRPGNLNEITPPDLNFEVLFGGEEAMYQGQLMAYKIQLLPLLKTRWLTEITQVRKPDYFVDLQRLGPYRFWHHQHHFRSLDNGVEMRDLVTYLLPLGILGDIVQRLWVGPRLEQIFDYRAEIISRIFPA